MSVIPDFLGALSGNIASATSRRYGIHDSGIRQRAQQIHRRCRDNEGELHRSRGEVCRPTASGNPFPARTGSCDHGRVTRYRSTQETGRDPVVLSTARCVECYCSIAITRRGNVRAYARSRPAKKVARRIAGTSGAIRFDGVGKRSLRR